MNKILVSLAFLAMCLTIASVHSEKSGKYCIYSYSTTIIKKFLIFDFSNFRRHESKVTQVS